MILSPSPSLQATRPSSPNTSPSLPPPRTPHVCPPDPATPLSLPTQTISRETALKSSIYLTEHSKSPPKENRYSHDTSASEGLCASLTDGGNDCILFLPVGSECVDDVTSISELAATVDKLQSSLRILTQSMMRSEIQAKKDFQLSLRLAAEHAAAAEALHVQERHEFQKSIDRLELDVKSILVQKNVQIERKRAEFAYEMSELHEEFLVLTRQLEVKRRPSHSEATSMRIRTLGKTLEERNDILSSLEEALETTSRDKDRLHREREFLRKQVFVLEQENHKLVHCAASADTQEIVLSTAGEAEECMRLLGNLRVHLQNRRLAAEALQTVEDGQKKELRTTSRTISTSSESQGLLHGDFRKESHSQGHLLDISVCNEKGVVVQQQNKYSTAALCAVIVDLILSAAASNCEAQHTLLTQTGKREESERKNEQQHEAPLDERDTAREYLDQKFEKRETQRNRMEESDNFWRDELKTQSQKYSSAASLESGLAQQTTRNGAQLWKITRAQEESDLRVEKCAELRKKNCAGREDQKQQLEHQALELPEMKKGPTREQYDIQQHLKRQSSQLKVCVSEGREPDDMTESQSSGFNQIANWRASPEAVLVSLPSCITPNQEVPHGGQLSARSVAPPARLLQDTAQNESTFLRDCRLKPNQGRTCTPFRKEVIEIKRLRSETDKHCSRAPCFEENKNMLQRIITEISCEEEVSTCLRDQSKSSAGGKNIRGKVFEHKNVAQSCTGMQIEPLLRRCARYEEENDILQERLRNLQHRAEYRVEKTTVLSSEQVPISIASQRHHLPVTKNCSCSFTEVLNEGELARSAFAVNVEKIGDPKNSEGLLKEVKRLQADNVTQEMRRIIVERYRDQLEQAVQKLQIQLTRKNEEQNSAWVTDIGTERPPVTQMPLEPSSSIDRSCGMIEGPQIHVIGSSKASEASEREEALPRCCPQSQKEAHALRQPPNTVGVISCRCVDIQREHVVPKVSRSVSVGNKSTDGRIIQKQCAVERLQRHETSLRRGAQFEEGTSALRSRQNTCSLTKRTWVNDAPDSQLLSVISLAQTEIQPVKSAVVLSGNRSEIEMQQKIAVFKRRVARLEDEMHLLQTRRWTLAKKSAFEVSTATTLEKYVRGSLSDPRLFEVAELLRDRAKTCDNNEVIEPLQPASERFKSQAVKNAKTAAHATGEGVLQELAKLRSANEQHETRSRIMERNRNQLERAIEELERKFADKTYLNTRARATRELFREAKFTPFEPFAAIPLSQTATDTWSRGQVFSESSGGTVVPVDDTRALTAVRTTGGEEICRWRYARTEEEPSHFGTRITRACQGQPLVNAQNGCSEPPIFTRGSDGIGEDKELCISQAVSAPSNSCSSSMGFKTAAIPDKVEVLPQLEALHASQPALLPSHNAPRHKPRDPDLEARTATALDSVVKRGSSSLPASEFRQPVVRAQNAACRIRTTYKDALLYTSSVPPLRQQLLAEQATDATKEQVAFSWDSPLFTTPNSAALMHPVPIPRETRILSSARHPGERRLYFRDEWGSLREFGTSGPTVATSSLEIAATRKQPKTKKSHKTTLRRKLDQTEISAHRAPQLQAVSTAELKRDVKGQRTGGARQQVIETAWLGSAVYPGEHRVCFRDGSGGLPEVALNAGTIADALEVGGAEGAELAWESPRSVMDAQQY